MTIVGVHGIWNFRFFSKADRNLAGAVEAISDCWAEWLAVGMNGGGPEKVPVAFYADCLNRGVSMGPEDDPEALEEFERQVFVEMVEEVRRAQLPPGAPEPVPLSFPGARYVVSGPAEWLSEHCGSVAVGVVTVLAREVGTYFGTDHAERRARARERVAEAIAEHRPRVLLAHSLGSVVAYEALHAHPELSVGTLVTLGSPLGVARVVFDRLVPAPGPRGTRPPNVDAWINIADRGDPVAIPSGRLGSRFDGVGQDYPDESIHKIDMHLARNYLGCARLAAVLGPVLAA